MQTKTCPGAVTETLWHAALCEARHRAKAAPRHRVALDGGNGAEGGGQLLIFKQACKTTRKLSHLVSLSHLSTMTAGLRP